MNMMHATQQEKVWTGNFGRAYTDRNLRSVEEMNRVFEGHIGVARTQLTQRFIGGLDRRIRILEVGCNVGVQLMALQTMGFTNLWGLELQRYAVKKAKQHTHGINFVQSSALKLPFCNGSFDLVFTSTVLIHISPQYLPSVLSEIVRCSRCYIWGYEYYESQMTEVNYRGNSDLLWKGDYVAKYQEVAPFLQLVQREFYRYLYNDNQDCMFLLKKPVA